MLWRLWSRIMKFEVSINFVVEVEAESLKEAEERAKRVIASLIGKTEEPEFYYEVRDYRCEASWWEDEQHI